MVILTVTSYKDKGVSALGMFLWITMHIGKIEANLIFWPKKKIQIKQLFHYSLPNFASSLISYLIWTHITKSYKTLVIACVLLTRLSPVFI